VEAAAVSAARAGHHVRDDEHTSALASSSHCRTAREKAALRRRSMP
jgi:hypothetical protein